MKKKNCKCCFVSCGTGSRGSHDPVCGAGRGQRYGL